jgi:hypothetical protein
MTPKSISSHLAPYSIFAKRRTTVAHAFASALAPTDDYDKDVVWEALKALGQSNKKELVCVYCDKKAQTWDHLVNLVTEGNLSGFGHQIGNLVPCCKECNSAKGSKPFREFVNSLPDMSQPDKTALIGKLEKHLLLAKPIEEIKGVKRQEAHEKFLEMRKQIYDLMKEADQLALIIRSNERES